MAYLYNVISVIFTNKDMLKQLRLLNNGKLNCVVNEYLGLRWWTTCKGIGSDDFNSQYRVDRNNDENKI